MKFRSWWLFVIVFLLSVGGSGGLEAVTWASESDMNTALKKTLPSVNTAFSVAIKTPGAKNIDSVTKAVTNVTTLVGKAGSFTPPKAKKPVIINAKTLKDYNQKSLKDIYDNLGKLVEALKADFVTNVASPTLQEDPRFKAFKSLVGALSGDNFSKTFDPDRKQAQKSLNFLKGFENIDGLNVVMNPTKDIVNEIVAQNTTDNKGFEKVLKSAVDTKLDTDAMVKDQQTKLFAAAGAAGGTIDLKDLTEVKVQAAVLKKVNEEVAKDVSLLKNAIKALGMDEKKDVNVVKAALNADIPVGKKDEPIKLIENIRKEISVLPSAVTKQTIKEKIEAAANISELFVAVAGKKLTKNSSPAFATQFESLVKTDIDSVDEVVKFKLDVDKVSYDGSKDVTLLQADAETVMKALSDQITDVVGKITDFPDIIKFAKFEAKKVTFENNKEVTLGGGTEGTALSKLLGEKIAEVIAAKIDDVDKAAKFGLINTTDKKIRYDSKEILFAEGSHVDPIIVAFNTKLLAAVNAVLTDDQIKNFKEFDVTSVTFQTGEKCILGKGAEGTVLSAALSGKLVAAARKLDVATAGGTFQKVEEKKITFKNVEITFVDPDHVKDVNDVLAGKAKTAALLLVTLADIGGVTFAAKSVDVDGAKVFLLDDSVKDISTAYATAVVANTDAITTLEEAVKFTFDDANAKKLTYGVALSQKECILAQESDRDLISKSVGDVLFTQLKTNIPLSLNTLTQWNDIADIGTSAKVKLTGGKTIQLLEGKTTPLVDQKKALAALAVQSILNGPDVLGFASGDVDAIAKAKLAALATLVCEEKAITDKSPAGTKIELGDEKVMLTGMNAGKTIGAAVIDVQNELAATVLKTELDKCFTYDALKTGDADLPVYEYVSGVVPVNTLKAGLMPAANWDAQVGKLGTAAPAAYANMALKIGTVDVPFRNVKISDQLNQASDGTTAIATFGGNVNLKTILEAKLDEIATIYAAIYGWDHAIRTATVADVTVNGAPTTSPWPVVNFNLTKLQIDAVDFAAADFATKALDTTVANVITLKLTPKNGNSDVKISKEIQDYLANVFQAYKEILWAEAVFVEATKLKTAAGSPYTALVGGGAKKDNFDDALLNLNPANATGAKDATKLFKDGVDGLAKLSDKDSIKGKIANSGIGTKLTVGTKTSKIDDTITAWNAIAGGLRTEIEAMWKTEIVAPNKKKIANLFALVNGFIDSTTKNWDDDFTGDTTDVSGFVADTVADIIKSDNLAALDAHAFMLSDSGKTVKDASNKTLKFADNKVALEIGKAYAKAWVAALKTASNGTTIEINKTAVADKLFPPCDVTEFKVDGESVKEEEIRIVPSNATINNLAGGQVYPIETVSTHANLVAYFKECLAVAKARAVHGALAQIAAGGGTAFSNVTHENYDDFKAALDKIDPATTTNTLPIYKALAAISAYDVRTTINTVKIDDNATGLNANIKAAIDAALLVTKKVAGGGGDPLAGTGFNDFLDKKWADGLAKYMGQAALVKKCKDDNTMSDENWNIDIGVGHRAQYLGETLTKLIKDHFTTNGTNKDTEIPELKVDGAVVIPKFKIGSVSMKNKIDDALLSIGNHIKDNVAANE